MLTGLLVGAVGGLGTNTLAHDARWARALTDYVMAPVGQVFLRLLFMLVVPLLFSALVLGVCELDLGHLGRLGGRMLGYTVVVSAIAVTLGVTLVNLIGPGRGVAISGLTLSAQSQALQATSAPLDTSPVALIVGIVPDNVVRAAANGDMLAISALSLIFGVGLALTKTDAAARLKEAIAGLYDVSMPLLGSVAACTLVSRFDDLRGRVPESSAPSCAGWQCGDDGCARADRLLVLRDSVGWLDEHLNGFGSPAHAG